MLALFRFDRKDFSRREPKHRGPGLHRPQRKAEQLPEPPETTWKSHLLKDAFLAMSGHIKRMSGAR